MNAIVFQAYGGPDVLQLDDVPAPVPGPGEVLIETKAASVNFADIKLRDGGYFLATDPPLTPGMDLAGIVTDVGPEVNEPDVGQRVAAHVATGAYAEQVVASAGLTWQLPDEIDFETGAAFPSAGITSYHLLTDVTRLQSGESILIHAAAGGVGSICVQLAKTLGAGSVIGTVGSEEKAELATSLGCDHIVLYRHESFGEKTLEWTGGAGVDVILDSIGEATVYDGFSCLANFGRMAVFGMASGKPGQTTTDLLHHTNRAIIGYSLSGHRSARPETLAQAGREILNYLQDGSLKLVIDARYPLAEAASAHEWIEERHSVGKVILLP